MKLTREQEAELMLVYETWWHSYLNGDINTYDSFLADDFHFVGSTNGEEYLNKKDTTAFFDATAHQLAGKAELRNLKRTIEELDGGLVLITDLADAYVISEPEWVFYSRFRFTSMMKETPNGWRFIYQHFSAPDTKAQEGETLGTEQITRENQELRDAIKRRTAELENKTRELEIESTLERIRNRTLLMKDSIELNEAATVFFQQLQTLNLLPAGARTYFCHINQETAVAEVWMTHANGSVMQSSHQIPLNNSPAIANDFEAWKRREPIVVRAYTGESLKEYLQFISSLPYVKDDKDYQQLLSSPPGKIVMTDANFLQGNIGVMTLEPLSPEALDILTRFAKVFEFTYTRFLDLQKAEAQAKEAQIQLALERVRARSMAMHKSEELAALSLELVKQVQALGVATWFCAFNIYDEDLKSSLEWGSNGQGTFPRYRTPREGIFLRYYEAGQRGETFLLNEIGKNECPAHYEYLCSLPGVGDQLLQMKDAGIPFPVSQIDHVAFFKYGYLLFITYEPAPAAHDIFMRFAKVFEQTYTRFLDLQKAEAQARESDIELALERVRAKTMAMQTSEELRDVIQVIHNQLVLLGFEISNSGIMLDYKQKDDFDLWMADSYEEFPVKVHIPYIDHPQFNSYKKAKEKSLNFYSGILTFEEKNEWFQHVFKNIKGVTEETKEAVYSSPGMATSGVLLKNISIYLLNYTGTPYSDAQNDTLMRFGKVFEQTYTRFSDLQQAEAQGREARIELGLERVRARAMAMQHSNELSDLVDTVFKELTKLDFVINMCIINIIDESTLSNMVWGANPDTGKPPESYYMKFEDYPFHHAMMKGYKERNTKFIYVIEGEEKKIYDEYLFTETEFRKMPLEAQAASKALKRYVASFTFSNFGGLQTVGDEPLSDSNLDILARFGKVFDLTYTRFNDLQKAEAQAREAQIEYGLEKVRSQTMGMQTSEDLAKVAAAMFDQIRLLGGNMFSCGIVLCDENKNEVDQWLSVPGIGMTPPFFVPKDLDFIHQYRYDQWKAGVELFSIEIPEDKIVHHFELLYALPSLKNIVDSAAAQGIALPETPKWEIDYGASFKYGYLLISALQPFRETFIFPRFAKVFDQTYTRFLDLQKAEAQAKEAKIEASLERVRSHSLAMQKSEELKEVIKVVYDQFVHLDIHIEHTGFIMDYKEREDMQIWLADQHAVPFQVTIPYFDCAHWNSFNEAKANGKHFFANHLSFEEKNKFYEDLFKLIPGVPKETLDYYLSCPGLAISTVLLDNVGLYIENFSGTPFTDDENNTLMRFGKVFQQTYTRFRDLQKAEAQTREAKIEAALEKARARTMGMQSSDELPEVANVLFLEVQGLGIPAWSCGYNILAEDKTSATCCMSSEGTLQTPFKLRLWGEASFDEMGDFLRSEDTMLVQELGDKAIDEHYAYMKSFPDLKPTFEQIDELGLSLPTYQINHLCKFTQGFLLFITYEKVPESHDIFKRFTRVFEQTYTRFLDLQKAEAQAREAKIEAALEKVRSRSLAMHKAEELKEVVAVVVEKLQQLGVVLDANGVIICTYFQDSKNVLHWIASPDYSFVGSYLLPYFDHPIFNAAWESKLSGDEYFSKAFSVEEKNSFFEYAFEHSDYRHFPDDFKQWIFQNDQHILSFAWQKNSAILIPSHTGVLPSADDIAILKRFANVFEQAYTRFLDLQKAEEQTREAQINLAVERVRARALAMFKSEEILQVVNKLKEEIMELEIPNVIAATIHLKENDGRCRIWDISSIEINDEALHHPLDIRFKLEDTDPNFFMRRIWGNTANYFVETQDEGDLKRTIQWLRDNGRNQQADETVQFIESTNLKRLYHPTIQLNNGRMGIDLLEAPAPEIESILEKMGAAFDLAYKRFEDLKNSEVQLREAQIENALEKVRSKAMSMHSSEDLTETIRVFYTQMSFLNGTPHRCGVSLFDKETHNSEFTSMYTTVEGKSVEIIAKLKLAGHPILEEMYEHWLSQKEYHPVLRGQEIKAYYQFIRPQVSFPDYAHDDVQFGYYFFFTEGTIYAWTEVELSEDELQVYRRFASVISLTYKRYKDLKLAEAQTREAKIEAALEKVRSRTMGMQQSDELGDVATVLFKELNQLVENLWTCGFVLCEKDRAEDEWWLSTESGFIPAFYLPNVGDRAHENLYKAWKDGETFHAEQIDGTNLEQHYEWLMNIPVARKIFEDMAVAGFQKPVWQKLHGAYFSKGYLCIITREPCPEEETFKRFAQVFDLTYTRFLDLQKAELQARQAKIETALEKVRARALAMQQPEELVEVAEVLRHEMGLLGVEELETCSIYIHDETINRTECWYALKDIRSEEKKLVSDHFPLNLHDTWVGRAMEKFYGSDVKKVSILMQGTHRKEWISYCEEKSIPLRGYYGEVIPDRTYHLYKFSHGAMGAASAGEISAESWDLLQRAASVFSLAYSRFKDLTQARFDLQRLKQEKQRAEVALSELQTTQKQLIQSEKMASLGELTAGIAHEIQNPLNFVNNFSEVSKEMLDEMREAIEKGDTEEAKEIMNDVIQNLEKINHHGKRADGIVKGMLQHSRSSTGQKEPTNVNLLADEYLRLAYHGLRAKDKSFNATLKTDYDEAVGNINIIPQDIGRVVLNLITNAFYVVSEKQKENIAGYEPTVSVSTKKAGDQVFIAVKDNGKGIPQHILDKIFQPFFTTKPTGQGTGLGLSLSYDIVKAHGGDLNVTTREGEGAEFIMWLPVDRNLEKRNCF